MLSNEDKAKIIDLRRQNFTYKAIRAETGFSFQTISNVIKGEKDKNLRAEEKTDLNKNVEDDFLQDNAVSFDSSIDKEKKIMVDINSLIKNSDLQEGNRREWAKRLDDLQGIIRVEMDDRIVEEITDAIAKRDDEWRNTIEQGYVEKGVVTNLDNTINEKDAAIYQLRNENAQKDTFIINKQDEVLHLQNSHQLEIQNLNGQLGNLSLRIQGLNSENWKMYNIIQDNAAKYEQREEEYVKRDRELSDKKIKFNKDVKEQELIQNKSFLEADKRYKEIETREKELAEQELQLNKRDDEFDKKIRQIFDVLNQRLEAAEKLEDKVNESANELLMQKNELAVEKRKIDDYKENQINEIKLYKEKQMEEIKKKKEELEKVKAEQSNLEQRLKKQQSLARNRDYSNLLKTLTSNSKPIGETDQKTGEQKKPVILRPI